MYPQGVCRIRKPASAGNGCAIFPAFDAEERAEKIRSSAADDLFRGSLEKRGQADFYRACPHLPDREPDSCFCYGFTP